MLRMKDLSRENRLKINNELFGNEENGQQPQQQVEKRRSVDPVLGEQVNKIWKFITVSNA